MATEQPAVNKSKSFVDSPVSLTTKASYGLGALGKDFAVSIIYVYLSIYFTDEVGLAPAFVGTLFLVARIIDAVTDPVMGMIVDNTRSKFGKFRPWIIIGTFANAGFLILLFSTHKIDGNWLYAYVIVTYILWGITYTIIDIPFWSMVPALCSARKERERLVVWPRLFASIAWWLMGAFGLYIAGLLGEGDKGEGFFVMSLVITAGFILSSILVVTNVKEKVATKVSTEKFGLKDVFDIFSKNDQLAALFGCILFFNLAIQLISSFAIFYFTYAVGKESLFGTFMFAAGLAEIAGIFLFPMFCSLIPRRLVWFFACGFTVLSCAVLAISTFTTPDNIFLIVLAGACFKFGFGVCNGLSTVMLADVVDYGEYKTGKRSESIIFSVQTLLVKCAGALAGFFTGVGLWLIGYKANEIQTADTIFGMQAIMIALPFVLMFFSAWIYHRWYRLHDGFSAPV